MTASVFTIRPFPPPASLRLVGGGPSSQKGRHLHKTSIFTLGIHRFPEDCPFERRTRVAGLDYIAQSDAARTGIAENYVGLPLSAPGIDPNDPGTVMDGSREHFGHLAACRVPAIRRRWAR